MVIEFAEFFPAKSGYLWVNWHQWACTLASLREAIMRSKTKSVAEVSQFFAPENINCYRFVDSAEAIEG